MGTIIRTEQNNITEGNMQGTCYMQYLSLSIFDGCSTIL